VLKKWSFEVLEFWSIGFAAHRSNTPELRAAGTPLNDFSIIELVVFLALTACSRSFWHEQQTGRPSSAGQPSYVTGSGLPPSGTRIDFYE
jgi:hypothetical protein